jgi:hypothetical protein
VSSSFMKKLVNTVDYFYSTKLVGGGINFLVLNSAKDPTASCSQNVLMARASAIRGEMNKHSAFEVMGSGEQANNKAVICSLLTLHRSHRL